MADGGEVLKNALSLSADDRALVAEKLLASLDDLEEQEAGRLWAEEAARRREKRSEPECPRPSPQLLRSFWPASTIWKSKKPRVYGRSKLLAEEFHAEEFHAGRAGAIEAHEVAKKAGKLLR